MAKTSLMTMKDIRDAMEARLAYEKARLVAALAWQLEDDGERVLGEFGAHGHMRLDGLQGTFYVNCDRRGEPREDVGRGEGQLSHYFWIPVVYRDGESSTSYTLSLFQEGLDLRSGDVRTCFGRLQLTCPTCGGPEIGSQASPKLEPANRDYLLHYRADDSFPHAIRAYGDGLQSRAVVDGDRPWGYSGFEDEIPALDLADPSYDPREVAAFFMRLVLRDLGV